MKFLFLLPMLLALPALACTNKIDNSKVMLFIDTNFSDPEIATASKAACARGERLLVVPSNYQEYTNQLLIVDGAKRAFDKCASVKSSKCAQETTKYLSLHSEFQKNFAKPLKSSIQEAMEGIRKDKAKITNFTISGHDGGGNFSGYKGTFDRAYLSALMEAYKDLNEVSSVLLLGCYTGVQKEMMLWQGMFPKARLIGGFDGSAPLSDKPAGHTYLQDLLLKEKAMIQQAEEEKLNKFARAQITTLDQLDAAIFVRPVCEEEKSFYYASKERGAQFKPWSTDCRKPHESLKKDAARAALYETGELEPPLNPSSGELRQIYDRARGNEHCLDGSGIPLNVSNVFNLRFYDAVKKNFTHFYEKELALSEKILSSITTESLKKNFGPVIALMEKEEQAKQDEISLLEKDPKKFGAFKEAELRKLEAEFAVSLKDTATRKAFEKWIINQKDETRRVAFANKDEERLFNQVAKLQVELKALQETLTLLKKDPKTVLQGLHQEKKNLMTATAEKKLNFDKLMKTPPKLWVPTSSHLASKSRKELLQNINRIHEVLSTQAVDKNQRAALQWIGLATTSHLQQFHNPFSWHEFTGKTETPVTRITLEEF